LTPISGKIGALPTILTRETPSQTELTNILRLVTIQLAALCRLRSNVMAQ